MKKNSAYTVSELAIVLIFMGVIMIIALHTLNNKATDYYSRYYTALDALRLAVYNTSIDTVSSDPERQDSTASQTNSVDEGRPFPTAPNARNGVSNNLCSRLKEYLNDSDAESGNNCLAPTVENGIFSDDKIQFSLTNDFRLYFSEKKSATILQGGEYISGTPDVSGHYATPATPENLRPIDYYIVYVDLNGDKKPNSIQAPLPDIVPFIVTTDGDVIPVGYPIYDKTYITARIVNSQQKQTISNTFDNTCIMAYGRKTYWDIPFTLTRFFDDKLPDFAKADSSLRNNGATLLNDSPDFECDSNGNLSCKVRIDSNLEGLRRF